MSSALKCVLMIGALGVIAIAIGCQQTTTPERTAIPEYQTVDSGLRDCPIPFEQLRQLSPACANNASRDGRRCEPYSPSQFPEVVQVRQGQGESDRLICTGTVIAANWVITAAHCVNGDEAASASASCSSPGAGPAHLSVSASFAYTLSAEYLHSTPDQNREVARACILPGYSGAPQYENDVALLQLAGPFPAGAVQPVTLARADQISARTTLAGYGISNAEGGSVGYLNVNWPADVSNDGHRMSFVPKDGTAFCKGDSGGPMFAGLYRGCKATDAGGEPRPRMLQAVVSSYSYKGVITPALSYLQQANTCIDSDRMIAQSVVDPKVRSWICTVTANQAQGC